MAKQKIEGKFTISDESQFSACVEYLTNETNFVFDDSAESTIEFFNFSDEDLAEIEAFMCDQFSARLAYE